MEMKKKEVKMPGDEGYFDPAAPKEALCLAESNRFCCTRPQGHKGNHAAHGNSTPVQYCDWPPDVQEDSAEEDTTN